MPNYSADPDIRSIQINGRFAIPDHLDPAELERLHRFLEADQVLEEFYRRSSPTERPPEADLRVAAETAMAVYDERSELLSVGWQKFAVLQAGIAGSPENLDSFEIQDWAYTRINDENPGWLGDFDEDVDREMPLRWLTQLIGLRIVMARQSEPAEPAPRKRSWFRR